MMHLNPHPAGDAPAEDVQACGARVPATAASSFAETISSTTGFLPLALTPSPRPASSPQALQAAASPRASITANSDSSVTPTGGCTTTDTRPISLSLITEGERKTPAQIQSNLVQPSSSFLRSPKSFRSRRQNALSIESIPRQTVLKALASARGPFSAGLEPSAAFKNKMDSLTINTLGSAMPDGLKHPLQSPCFFHEKFDDVINIDKVLEEVKEVQDDSNYTSHHGLLQTATGVREVARQLGRRPVKMQVRSVMIVTKARDNTLVTLTREVAHWLMKTPRYGSDMGVTVYVDEKLQKSKRFDAEGLVRAEPRFAGMLKYWTPDLCWKSPGKFDLVLTLGGDGTVLFTSWLFQQIVPPILSFSLGSLGFLTNFPFEMYKEHLDNVLTEGMRINLRMRFTCTVYRGNKGQMEEAEQFEVLNGTYSPGFSECIYIPPR